MRDPEYIPPTFEAEAFNCANCRVYAKQEWFYMNASERKDGWGTNRYDQRFMLSYCVKCGFPTIWYDETIVFPEYGYAEPPNTDMPENVRNDYDEARVIVYKSPRGAAALLRLCVQKLCKHLGKSGSNINSDIRALVAEGLPQKVQQALDSVRVIGNNAVHPGELDFRDDAETAIKLFKLVNFIVTKMISEPQEIDEIYGSLPPRARDAIDKRDVTRRDDRNPPSGWSE